MTRVSTASGFPSSRAGAIDYLIIGHVTTDLTPDGPRLGGTASYASLSAMALGLRVGLVTACQPDLDLTPLAGIAIQSRPASHTTTFRNTTSGGHRHQILSARSDALTLDDVPLSWRSAPIVHLAPVADEVPRALAAEFEAPFLGITPQGWWRKWDDAGRVSSLTVDDALARLPSVADAAVFSRDDLEFGPGSVGVLRRACRCLAITDGPCGSDVFWDEEQVHIPAPVKTPADETGAGDVFAAVFFTHLASGRLPDDAAAEATRWASASVAHAGADWIRAEARDALLTGPGR